MFIKSVVLKNIRSYLDEKIVFPEGSTLLSGDIGSGKSTILLAIDFALFGLRRGELDGSDLLRHGENSGTVELNLSLNGKNVIIKRCLKRGKGIAQDSGFMEIDGIKEEYTPSELRSYVLSFLGYPGGSKESIFRYSVYTPQEEMKQILQNKERIMILRKIFGVDKYGIIRENTKIVVSELRSMKRELDAFSKDIEANENILHEKESMKMRISEDLILATEKSGVIEKRFQEIKSEIDFFEKTIEDMKIIKQSIIKKDAELQSRKNSLNKLERDAALLKSRLVESQKNLELYKNLKQPEKTPEQIREDIRSIEKERYNIISQKAVLSEDAKKLRGILEKGICEICGQKVHDPASFKNNIEAKEHTEKHIVEKVKRIDENLFSLKKIEEEINNYRVSIEKKNSLERISSQLMADMRKIEEEEKQAVDSVNSIENEIFLLKPKIAEMEEKELTIRKMKERLSETQIQKFEVEKTKSRLEQQVQDINEHILFLIEEINKKSICRKKSEKLKEIINWFDLHFLNLTEVIEKHVMVMIQKEFDQFFKSWFNIIMSDENLGVRVDEKFSPVIEQNGYETNYENLSGGEKTAVALAYRLSLNKVINSLVEEIKTKDILILDEPTDGFSTEQLDRIRYVIEELNLKQIIIVSHEPKIDTFVDNVIRVYKEGHVSRILN